MPTVLIVDDEANIVASLQGALGREGYQVEGARNLTEARDRLRGAFDIVLPISRNPLQFRATSARSARGKTWALLVERGGALRAERAACAMTVLSGSPQPEAERCRRLCLSPLAAGRAGRAPRLLHRKRAPVTRRYPLPFFRNDTGVPDRLWSS